MKNNFKKVMSIVLTVLMVIAVVPFTGLAADCNHVFDGDLFDRVSGQHAYWCSECNLVYGNGTTEGTVACTGGTATCKDAATCTVCLRAYGEKNENNHIFSAKVATEDYLVNAATCISKPEYYYSCTLCDISEENKNHTFFEGTTDLVNGHKAVDGVYTANGDGTHTIAECELCGNKNITVSCTSETKATCTTKAVCDYCETVFGGVDAENHTNVVDVAKKDATCQEAGYEAHKYCEACETVVGVKTVINKKDHYYSKIEKIEGTNTHKKTCVTCEGEAPANIVEACTGGTATCTTKAVCTVCGEAYGDYAHEWDNGTVTTPATCSATGVKTYECTKTDCDETKTEEIAIDETAHSWGTEIKKDEENNRHYIVCTYNSEHRDYDECTYTEAVATDVYLATDATCTEQATYYKSCSVCGAAGTETFKSGELAPHNFKEKLTNEAHIISKATCLKEAEYWYDCTGCELNAKDVDKTDMSDAEIAELKFKDGEKAPHNYSKEITSNEKYAINPPTCTVDGIYWYSCAQEGCNANAKDVDKTGMSDAEIAQYYFIGVGTKLGHKAVPYEGKDPTCTVAGYTDYIVCERENCGTFLKEKVERPATGHKEYISVEKQEATCTKVGHSEEKRCAVCEQLLSLPSMTTNALGHVDEDGDEICDRAGCNTIVSGDEQCSCLCHTTGFMRVIYVLVKLIWKLIGANKYCDCGIEHY